MKHDSGLQPLLWILLIILAGGALLVYDIDLLTYVLIAVGVLLFAGALFVIFYSGFWVAKNKLSPVMRVEARVVRRRKEDWDIGLVGGPSELERLGMMGRDSRTAWKAYSRRMEKGDVRELNIASGADYFVTFDVNGQECEFLVSEDYYIKCSEETQGLLVYRGEEFMYFVPGVAQMREGKMES